jgi:hypothetical protein
MLKFKGKLFQGNYFKDVDGDKHYIRQSTVTSCLKLHAILTESPITLRPG